MTYPFTPLKTFINGSVPKVTADDLMSFQGLENALAWRTYLSRGDIDLRSTDGATLTALVSPLMIKDSTTGLFVYCAFPLSTVDLSNMDTSIVNWPASTWVYVYAYCDNQVPGIECSVTPPSVIMPSGAIGVETVHRLFKDADETRRYIGCFWSDSGNQIRRFRMTNYRYRWFDDANVLNLYTGTATGWTSWQSVSLAAAVGPYADSVGISADMIDNPFSYDVSAVLSPNSTGPGKTIATIKPNDFGGYSARASGHAVMPLLAPQIYGRVTALSPVVQLNVTDWSE